VVVNGKTVDAYETLTAFRDFRFDAQTGFWLNGKNMKLNGVCEHHDFGCLGAVVNEDAMHRKLTKLKAMGVNAIRSSHNPPAPELLNMCDTMGLIVMDESFDMWRRRKTQNDYARFFDEWHERDLTDLVLRDRNHPCILMWSIGNEVLEQWSSAEADTLTLEQANLILNAGHDASTLAKDGETSVNTLLADHLAEIVRRYDTTRPITAGCNEPSPNNHLFKGKAIDVIGFNYHHEWIKDVPKNFPGRPFIMTESVSALQTTGFYMMPSDSIRKAPQEWWLPYTDPTMMCSAYDNMHASWSSTHEETWDVVKHTPYVGGQFIWTGFDYIGEPTPYSFPARSSYFGIIDLAGQPKDVYYMYQSEWTDQPVLHLFPHWNWLEGQEIDMWCYYNHADEVELFVNGKSQGIRRKMDGHQYHVMWRVKYESGEVKVVARKAGKQVREQVIKTAGQPDHIQLSIDYRGKTTTFVKAEVVDKDGNRCPWAENQVFFETDAEIIGVDNGCQTSMERFKDTKRKAFFGRCFAVVSGHGTLTAKAIGLKSNTIKL
jgi:beta-galactosidase